MAQLCCAFQNGNCKPGEHSLHGLHRRDEQRPVGGEYEPHADGLVAMLKARGYTVEQQ